MIGVKATLWVLMGDSGGPDLVGICYKINN